MDISSLEGLGLTPGEIKVYLTLLSLGSVKVGMIIEKSNLQSSVVHNCLHKLMEKGLVSFVKKGKITYYQTANPRRIIQYIDEKKKKVQEMLPELLAKQAAGEKAEAEVFLGTKGVNTAYYEPLIEMKKGDENLFFSFTKAEYTEERIDALEKYCRFKKEKGIISKGIAPIELKELLSKGKFPGVEFRYVKFPVPSGLSIFNNSVFIPALGENPIGFLI